MDNNREVLKSGVWYMFSNFIVKGMIFITTPIFTRLMTHEDFGLYNNYTSWLGIFTVLVTLNLGTTFISAKFDFSTKFDEYIFSVLTLSALLGILWLVPMNIFSVQVSERTGIDRQYLNLMILYLIALPAVDMFQGRERYAYKYKVSVFLSVLLSVFTAAVSVGLVLQMDNKLTGRIIGSVVPTIIIGAVLYLYLAKKGKKVNVKYWKYAFPICLPFIPHGLSLIILNSMDRMMITDICGPEDNALYSLAYTCGAVITLIVSSMNTAFSPWLGEKLHARQNTVIYDVSQKYILLFVALAAGVMLVTPEILLVMGGKSYQEAIYVMPPVAFGCVCQFLYTMFVNIEQFEKKTVGMAFASVSAALINYGLNTFFIPKYGYIAAAYTTLASFLWLLFIHMLFVKRLGYTRLYPVKFIFVVLAGMSFYTVAVNYLYVLAPLRYALVLVYGILFFFFGWRYRKKIQIIFQRSEETAEDSCRHTPAG